MLTKKLIRLMVVRIINAYHLSTMTLELVPVVRILRRTATPFGLIISSSLLGHWSTTILVALLTLLLQMTVPSASTVLTSQLLDLMTFSSFARLIRPSREVSDL